MSFDSMVALCKPIMDNVKFKETFKEMTVSQQDNHMKRKWAVWYSR